eukprot:Opistho-1_new@33256
MGRCCSTSARPSCAAPRPEPGARRPGPVACLARTESGDYRGDRPHDDQRVEPRAEVADIIEVVLQLVEDVGDVRDMALVDLRPAGDARPHDMAVAVERQFLLIPFGEHFRLGPRPDPAHLAAQDVHDLRQLVDARPAQEPAEPGDARIIVAGHRRAPRILGHFAASHRAELEHRERAPAIAHAGLAEERRAGRFSPDRNGDNHEDRQQRDQRQRRGNHIDDVLQSQIGVERDERAERVFPQMIDANPARHRFIKLLGIHHRDTVQGRVRQEPLPIVRQIGPQIGGDDLLRRHFRQAWGPQTRTEQARHIVELFDVAERHHADADRRARLAQERDCVEPDIAADEPEDQDQAIIVPSRNDQHHDDQRIADTEGREHEVAGMRTGIGGHALIDVIAQQQPDHVGHHRVQHQLQMSDVSADQHTQQPRRQDREQQAARKLIADPLQHRSMRHGDGKPLGIRQNALVHSAAYPSAINSALVSTAGPTFISRSQHVGGTSITAVASKQSDYPRFVPAAEPPWTSRASTTLSDSGSGGIR